MIDAANAADLKTVYMMAFDGFAVVPSDIVAEHKHINSRYARELLGALVYGQMLTIEEGDEGDCWMVKDPGTHDDHTREEAEATIDKWLGVQAPPTQGSPSSKAAKSASKDPHDCLCGCGEVITTKALYRPGHDARQAGQVGREIAAIMSGGHDEDGQIKINTLLEMLPTEALKAKAQRVADTANRKNLKAAKPEPTCVEGTVKVGKNERVARRWSGGTTEYLDAKGEWKPASAAANRTFQEG